MHRKSALRLTAEEHGVPSMVRRPTSREIAEEIESHGHVLRSSPRRYAVALGILLGSIGQSVSLLRHATHEPAIEAIALGFLAVLVFAAPFALFGGILWIGAVLRRPGPKDRGRHFRREPTT